MYGNMANVSPNSKFETIFAAEHARAMNAIGNQQAHNMNGFAHFMQQQAANHQQQGRSFSLNQRPVHPMLRICAMLGTPQQMMAAHGIPMMPFQFNPMAMAALAANNQYLVALQQGAAMLPATVMPQPTQVAQVPSATKSNKKKRPVSTTSATKTNKRAKSKPRTSRSKTSEGKSKRGGKRSTKGRSSGKICQIENCTKLARSTTLFCAAHGGGRRCQHPDCKKSARGATNYCIAHGGGRRCNHEGCTKSAQGSTFFCIAHGGGRRCKFVSCEKSARGPSGFCKSHGGGRRCAHTGCYKCAADNSPYCRAHGGKVCLNKGCEKSVPLDEPFCALHGGKAFAGGKPSASKRKTIGLPSGLMGSPSLKKAATAGGDDKVPIKGMLPLGKEIARDNVVPFSSLSMPRTVKLEAVASKPSAAEPKTEII